MSLKEKNKDRQIDNNFNFHFQMTIFTSSRIAF